LVEFGLMKGVSQIDEKLHQRAYQRLWVSPKLFSIKFYNKGGKIDQQLCIYNKQLHNDIHSVFLEKAIDY